MESCELNNKLMKKSFVGMWAVLAMGAWLVSSCTKNDNQVSPTPENEKSIVILYENDVHGTIEGYEKFAGLRDAIVQGDSAWVGTVSCGDYLQGGVVAAISHGRYVVDVMRKVGYHAITLGNHEFDYGGDHMIEALKYVNAPVVCANFFEYGADEPIYAPYVIRHYGDKKVAFVGVCTPSTMQSESYAFYDEKGNQLYDLRMEEVYTIVQEAVDKARGEGADYVVLLAHLGEVDKGDGVTSQSMTAATRGIDVVLDGHSHAVIEMQKLPNADGEMIPLSQTGTNFAYVGKLLIGKDGSISTTLMPTADMTYSNADVAFSIDSVKKEMEPIVQRKLAECSYDLTIMGEDGKRRVRTGETNIGDMIADAIRSNMGSDIGFTNGGGVRNSIPAGAITYGNVFNVLPNDNALVEIEVTGDMIVDMLAGATKMLPKESGNFPQVSGLRFTVHSVSHTVSDVQVLDKATGEYKAIDESASYTIATIDYCTTADYFAKQENVKVVRSTSLMVRDAVADYLENTLGGKVGSIYEKLQGRIIVVND